MALSEMYATMWRNTHLSDGMLVLRPPYEPQPVRDEAPPARKRTRLSTIKSNAATSASAIRDTPADMPELTRIPIHRMVWALHSEYFNTLVSRWVHGTVVNTELEIQPDELPAYEGVLKFFYTNKLDDTVSVTLLLAQLRVCDRLQASACMEVVCKALEAVASESIAYDDIITFYSLPTTILSSKPCSNITCMLNAVRRIFGNIDTVCSSDLLRNQFMALPACAVSALLSRDDLETSSENCVLLLASCWAMHGHGKNCDDEEVKQVAAVMRLSELSLPYAQALAPQLQWLGMTTRQHHLVVMQMFMKAKNGPLGDQDVSCSLFIKNSELPAAWLLRGRRKGTLHTHV